MFHSTQPQLPAGLAESPFFHGLSPRQWELVSRVTFPVTLPAGAILARQRGLGREFIIIASGTVRLERDGVDFGQLRPGDFFGDVALIDGRPHLVSVIAETEVQLLVADRYGFATLRNALPGFERELLARISGRLHEAQETGTCAEMVTLPPRAVVA